MFSKKDAINIFLRTPTAISVIVAISLVIWQVTSNGLPLGVQIVVSSFFLLVAGIPHGAIDHIVDKETAKRIDKSFNITYFIVKYLFVIVVYACAWLWQPSASLILFIVISAWHFGETDIENTPYTIFWNIAKLFFGFLVLGYLLLTHATEVTSVIGRITQNNEPLMNFWHLIVDKKMEILGGLLTFFMLSYILAQSKQRVNLDKMRALRLIIILFAIQFLPLIVAFSLYFGGWHALCSFKSIHNYIKLSDNKMILSPLKSAISIWSKTFLFSLLAIVFIGLFVWYWFNYQPNKDPLPLLFVFLSLITLPHLIVMHGMNKNMVRE